MHGVGQISTYAELNLCKIMWIQPGEWSKLELTNTLGLLKPLPSQTGQNWPLYYFTLSNARRFYVTSRESFWVGKG